MKIEEQNKVKMKYYAEALRYMENARETLKKAGKDGNEYEDDKYVKTACGIAYNGVLKALDGYFKLKDFPLPKNHKSIEYYRDYIGDVDRKLLSEVNTAYGILHILGYYEGIKNVKIIRNGFESAFKIIEKIKPAA